MKIWKVILAALVIFGAGVVTGGLVVGLKSRPTAPPPRSSQPSWNSRPRGDLVDRMQRELELTSDQRTRVEQIFRESSERSKQIWESAREEHRRLKASLRETLAAEDQKQKFDEMFKPRTPFKPGESRSRDSHRSGERSERKPNPGLDSAPGQAAPTVKSQQP